MTRPPRWDHELYLLHDCGCAVLCAEDVPSIACLAAMLVADPDACEAVPRHLSAWWGSVLEISENYGVWSHSGFLLADMGEGQRVVAVLGDARQSKSWDDLVRPTTDHDEAILKGAGLRRQDLAPLTDVLRNLILKLADHWTPLPVQIVAVRGGR